MAEGFPSIDDFGELACTLVFVSDQVRCRQCGAFRLFLGADNPRGFHNSNHADLDLLQSEIFYQTQMG